VTRSPPISSSTRPIATASPAAAARGLMMPLARRISHSPASRMSGSARMKARQTISWPAWASDRLVAHQLHR